MENELLMPIYKVSFKVELLVHCDGLESSTYRKINLGIVTRKKPWILTFYSFLSCLPDTLEVSSVLKGSTPLQEDGTSISASGNSITSGNLHYNSKEFSIFIFLFYFYFCPPPAQYFYFKEIWSLCPWDR